MGLPSLGRARQGSAMWMANKNRIHRKRPLFAVPKLPLVQKFPFRTKGRRGVRSLTRPSPEDLNGEYTASLFKTRLAF